MNGLGMMPVSTTGLESDPDPAANYDEAVQRFQAVVEEEQAIVNEAGFSQLMIVGEETELVYMLIHGTTNSPLQFVELGEILYALGHNVLILRMPHHGLASHDVGELANLKAEELRAYADSAVDIAAGLGEETIVIGLSGGGAVAAWIAQNRDDVERVVTLSPFFGVPEAPPYLNTFLMNLASRVPSVTLKDPAEPEHDWVYQGEATRGVAEFMRLGRAVFAEAGELAPAVAEIHFITTAIDDTADNDYTAELADMWREADAAVTTFEFDEATNIPHNSVDPAKKALVYTKILDVPGEEPLE
ncbi:MAG: alpha/beta fold hydrolase [Chloroflexota bacterium]|nr:MAG: alpha/beta fold hydrolase [Chloroflexota bacterium]